MDSLTWLDYVNLAIAIIALAISVLGVLFNRRRTIANEKSLETRLLESEQNSIKYTNELVRHRKQTRQEFLSSLFEKFSYSNWSLITHWEFPGIYPTSREVREMLESDDIPNQDERKKLFGEWVIATEYFNVLYRVFTYKENLAQGDLEGFISWANGWYDGCRQAITTILNNGDTFPLDYIIWLRDKVFFNQGDFQMMFGENLKVRLNSYQSFRETEGNNNE